MRKAISFFTVLLLAVTFAGCQPNTENISELGSYTNSKPLDNMTVDILDTYTETENVTQKGIGEGKTYRRGDGAISVTFQPVGDTYATVEDYAAYAKEQYQAFADELSQWREFYVDTKNYKCKVNSFIYLIKSGSQSVEMFTYAGYILSRGTVFIVTCTAPPESVSEFLPEFEFTMKSIQII
ncbi:MAG: hypothetical protein LBR54_04090 [Oscillospiraceae bacterium]|jgi:hypothetical protein|nr:hypothetical protein [Oscillospiraceae bacterium]